MTLISLALLHIEEATHHYQKAARILEMIAKDENAKIRKTVKLDAGTERDTWSDVQNSTYWLDELRSGDNPIK